MLLLVLQFSSTGPVKAKWVDDMETDDINTLISSKVNIVSSLGKKKTKDLNEQEHNRKRKIDPEMQLEGNEQIGKRKKKEIKKKRKEKVRMEKKTDALVGALEDVGLGDEEYNFDDHFAVKV